MGNYGALAFRRYLSGDEPGLTPCYFRALLDPVCNWPRCGGSRSGLVVEHWHGCDMHEGRKACFRCIRGRVHHSCNAVIAKWDWAIRMGLGPIPDDVMRYMEGRPLGNIGSSGQVESTSN